VLLEERRRGSKVERTMDDSFVDVRDEGRRWSGKGSSFFILIPLYTHPPLRKAHVDLSLPRGDVLPLFTR
jgi:hypothetical protein